jgi:hypothetical protein
MGRYAVAWLVMLLLAVANGSVRDFTYGRWLPALPAQQVSTLSAALLFGVVIGWVVRHWPFGSARQAWLVGVAWMAATVAFEFLFFHYGAGHPWDVLWANYDLSRGRLWPLLLVWLAVAPYLFYRLNRRR